MSQLLPLIQTVYNLKNVQRTGFNLFAGVPQKDIICIAVHSFLVAELGMIVGDMAEKENLPINKEVLLKLALYHDWGEAILGDYPDKSPSYQSYFEDNIREIHKKAEKKARLAMLSSLQPFMKNNYEELLTSEQFKLERDLFSLTDELALLVELIDVKFAGARYEWFDKLYENQFACVQELSAQFPFLKSLIEEMETQYQKEQKSPNPYITGRGGNS